MTIIPHAKLNQENTILSIIRLNREIDIETEENKNISNQWDEDYRKLNINFKELEKEILLLDSYEEPIRQQKRDEFEIRLNNYNKLLDDCIENNKILKIKEDKTCEKRRLLIFLYSLF